MIIRTVRTTSMTTSENDSRTGFRIRRQHAVSSVPYPYWFSTDCLSGGRRTLVVRTAARRTDPLAPHFLLGCVRNRVRIAQCSQCCQSSQLECSSRRLLPPFDAGAPPWGCGARVRCCISTETYVDRQGWQPRLSSLRPLPKNKSVCSALPSFYLDNIALAEDVAIDASFIL
jgi:hypothetical protein